MGLQSYSDAISSYKKGLEIDPNNDALKSGLADAESASSRSSSRSRSPSPFGEAFGPEMWVRLASDSSTRGYLEQPDFVKMMQDIQKSPNNLNLYMKDPRVMQSLGVLLNLKFQTRGGDDDEMFGGGASSKQTEEAAPEPMKEEKVEKEPEYEPMEEVPDEEKEKKERKVQAQKEKEAGNAAYKKKEFEKAIDHYTKAIELDDEDISFITNRAAVYLETGKVHVCLLNFGIMMLICFSYFSFIHNSCLFGLRYSPMYGM